ncbi:hypothetical protein MTO96_011742 [Rhipicephalus appendiculatus]
MEEQAPSILEQHTIQDLELSTEAGHVPENLASPPAERQPLTPPLSNENQPAVDNEVAPKFTEVQTTRSVCAEAAPHVTGKGSLANQYLEKIGQLRGATVLSEGGHDTCVLAVDLTSIDGSQKQPDRCQKEEFWELCTKKSLGAARFAPKLQAQPRTEADAVPDGERSSEDFDDLPVRRRIDFWKRLEDSAIRQGLIVNPKMVK